MINISKKEENRKKKMVKVNLFFNDLGNDLSLLTISFQMNTIFRIFFFFFDYCSFHAAICLGIMYFWLEEIERKRLFFLLLFFGRIIVCVLTMDHAGVSTRYCASTKENEYLRWVLGIFLFCFFFLSQEMNRMRCSDEWCHFLHYHICLFSFLFFFMWKCFNIKTKERNKLKNVVFEFWRGNLKKKHSNQYQLSKK